MNDLRLTGIHDDGEHLVLESSDGTQFSLPIDQNLRSSIAKARRIQPARGRSGNGSFGPRDIQARFRQGATVEEIAAESGWDAERVRRYEWPIVAERANIITVARRVVISPAATGRRSDPGAKSLDQYIAQVREKYGFTDAEADWNTFQQESGQWTLSVDFDLSDEAREALPRSIEFPARWSYNPANQSLYASNEAAYFLMGRDHSEDAPLPGIGSHTNVSAEPERQESTEPTREDQPASSSAQPQRPEVGNRAGARDYNSARERKLADLLERARRTSETKSYGVPVVNEVSEKSSASFTSESPDEAQSAQDNSASENSTTEPQSTDSSSDADQGTESTSSSEQAESQQQGSGETASGGEQTAPDRSESAPMSSGTTQENEQDSPENPEGAQQENDSDAHPVSPFTQNALEDKDSQDDDAESPSETTDEPSEQTEQSQPKPETPASRPSINRTKRTSVPSWDDIIFGNRR
ncbi:septation protein SepH [Rothia sp. LK2588]|uniref:septation protein SepH n=1 Tax=Rothia sp. LK2588 TaxID=3114369 RepID=UPI0034CE4D97